MDFLKVIAITEEKRQSNEELSKLLPSGSGFDCGCSIENVPVMLNYIVNGKSFSWITHGGALIKAPYHHMDENGFYCGWCVYTLLVVDGEIVDIDTDTSELDVDTDTSELDVDFEPFSSFIMDSIQECVSSIPNAVFIDGKWILPVRAEYTVIDEELS
jgi:hypothetical protein